MARGLFSKLINQVQNLPGQGLTLQERLMGQEMPTNDSINMDAELLKGINTNTPEFRESMGLYEGEENPIASISVSNPKRIGGILPDLAKGYNENYATGFAAPNWGQNQTDDGRNKGFAYRLGEGLGSVGRFIDSPLGRGLMAAGLNSMLGYDNSLQEGLTAAVGRQNAQTADRLYRNQLKRDYGYTDEDLQDIRGNIDTRTFNDLTKSQNSAMNLEIRKQTAQSMNKLRELQAEKQKIINSTLPEMQKAKLIQELTKAEHAEEMQLAKINYYNNAVANPLGWANYGLKADENERKNKELEAKIAALEKLTGDNTESEPETKPKHNTNAF